MEKILISIITPTYNHEKFIGQCIDSVLNQTYQNWEMIIIDDGSTDRTNNVVSEYDDDRIKYVKQENIGISNLNNTYNKALKMSNGDLIAILEGDDYWPQYKLEKQITCFNDSEVVLSWGEAAIINDDEVVGYYPYSFERFKKMPNNKIITNLFFGNFVPACTVMIRRDALMKINGFNQPLKVPYVDYPTWLKLSLRGDFFCYDEIMGFWRHHETQTSRVMLFSMFNSMQFSIKFFKNLSKKNKRKININLSDLKDYNINQIKYNFGESKNYKTYKRVAKKHPEEHTFLLNGLIILLRIFYAIKMNISWIRIILSDK